jgi:CheY-like chemotaxis protein
MPDTLESKALQQAVQLFGSVTALSQWLKVPSDTLTDWITGDGVPPKEILLRVAHLLRSSGKRGTAHVAPPSPSAVSPGAGLGMRVLIVASDRDALMTLGIVLRSEGFELRLLDRGADAEQAVREFRPHSVLVDLRLPQRSGYEIARELTRVYGSARPFLIAIAASNADEQAAKSCGFHHHVSRPYDPQELLSVLASLNRKA